MAVWIESVAAIPLLRQVSRTSAADSDVLAVPASRSESDSIEDRPYIEVRPAETPLDPTAVEQAMDLVEVLLRNATKTGLRHILSRSAHQPVVEWLFVSNGREDPSIRYLVGTTDDDLVEDLDGILRTCFPNTYEFRRVRWHPRRIDEHLPITVPTTDPPPNSTEPSGPHHPAITPDRPYVAGVEYVGRIDRRHDWQTPLKSYTDLASPVSDTHTDRTEARRVPTASLIETMCDATTPVIVQVIIRSHRDWTRRANTYLRDLEEGTVTIEAKIRDGLFPRDRDERRRYRPPSQDRKRIEGITARDPRRTRHAGNDRDLLRQIPSRFDP